MRTRDADVLVVGAGAAGLATAACLLRRGRRPLVIDRGDGVGDVWRARYDRLHLHTPRVQSGLPGFPIPASAGRWVARDDVATYLARYADHHGIRPELGVEVGRLDREDGHWVARAGPRSFRAGQVVLACGLAREPVLPRWADGAGLPVLHSSQYRDPAPFAGRAVLVVGAGNSGAEIAADLADGGAGSVQWSIRTPPTIVPRQLGPVPTSLLGIFQDHLPAPPLDALNRLVRRVFVGDLRGLGLPAPTRGLVTAARESGTTPLIDVGVLDALRRGRVRVVPAVTRVEGGSVTFADGHRSGPDVVVAATGWSPALTGIVGHLGVLDRDGRPLVHGGAVCGRAPGLRFVGFRTPLKGALLQINLDARRAARAIAAEG